MYIGKIALLLQKAKIILAFLAYSLICTFFSHFRPHWVISKQTRIVLAHIRIEMYDYSKKGEHVRLYKIQFPFSLVVLFPKCES